MTDTTANTLVIFPLRPKEGVSKLLAANTTVADVVYLAGSEGAVIDRISIVSEEATPYDVMLYIDDRPLGWVTVPARAGYDVGVPAVAALADSGMAAHRQADGSIILGAASSLKAAVDITVLVSVTVCAMGGDY